MIRIFLTGYMGAGKTTLGKAFARELNIPFIDLDWYIEERLHKSIRELFIERGEASFRELERTMLHDHRNRSRTVGSRDVNGYAALRHRPESFHGQGELQPETLPQADDEHLGRRRVCLAERNYSRRTGRPCKEPQRFGQSGHGDLRSRRNGAAKSSGYPLQQYVTEPIEGT